MTDVCKNITLPQTAFAGGNEQNSASGVGTRPKFVYVDPPL